MSRDSLTGIGRAIKANTVEKSIEELRAEGKKRVRVVSSERVMAIIQAIVDDTISSEVGEITKRDRDRIVSDTQERFSRVLKMQQDLEQDVDDLRRSLRTAESERERLRADKAHLETQLEVARRADGETDGVARLGRELARVREAVERAPRDAGALDDVAVSRVAEKLAARDAQNARRLAAEFDDLRTRLDAVSRDAVAARDAAVEKVLQRAKEQPPHADPELAARLDRDFRTVAEHLADIRMEIGRAPVAGDAVSRLRGDLAALENRIHGVERSSADLPERVCAAVMDRLVERMPATDVARSGAAASHDAPLEEALRRLQQSADDGNQTILIEMARLRQSADDARTLAMSVHADRLHDLELGITDGVSERTGALARTVESLAQRTASLDGSLQGLRADLAGAIERADVENAKAPAAVTAALVDLRSDGARAAEAWARTAEVQAALASRLDGSISDLRREFLAMTARSVEAAERQHEAVKALREHISLNAAVETDALQSGFKAAMETALDKIVKTMRAATARPIEIDGEATELLVSRMFDTPDDELTSNLDQLDVEEHRSQGSIAKSVGRLREMSGRSKTGVA